MFLTTILFARGPPELPTRAPALDFHILKNETHNNYTQVDLQ